MADVNAVGMQAPERALQRRLLSGAAWFQGFQHRLCLGPDAHVFANWPASPHVPQVYILQSVLHEPVSQLVCLVRVSTSVQVSEEWHFAAGALDPSG